MSFDNKTIEQLITKAKSLDLSYLRVSDDDDEIAIELPRSAKVPQPIEVPASSTSHTKDVISHFVGYFRPNSQVGAAVQKTSVVGVVESLGLPNDVLAGAAGTVVEITKQEGDAVEYGTVIARIET